jgi:hypothetical protein
MDRAPARQLLHKVEGRLRLAVNGRFQPTIKTNANQTEMWVLSNVSDFAYMNLQLTETATGYHPKIAIVKEDGNPFSAVHYAVTDDGTRLLNPARHPSRRRHYHAGERRSDPRTAVPRESLVLDHSHLGDCTRCVSVTAEAVTPSCAKLHEIRIQFDLYSATLFHEHRHGATALSG